MLKIYSHQYFPPQGYLVLSRLVDSCLWLDIMLIDLGCSGFLSSQIIYPSFKTEQLQLPRAGFGISHSRPLTLIIVIVHINIFNRQLAHRALIHFQSLVCISISSRRTSLIVNVAAASLHISLVQIFPTPDRPGNVADVIQAGQCMIEKQPTNASLFLIALKTVIALYNAVSHFFVTAIQMQETGLVILSAMATAQVTEG